MTPDDAQTWPPWFRQALIYSRLGLYEEMLRIYLPIHDAQKPHISEFVRTHWELLCSPHYCKWYKAENSNLRVHKMIRQSPTYHLEVQRERDRLQQTQ